MKSAFLNILNESRSPKPTFPHCEQTCFTAVKGLSVYQQNLGKHGQNAGGNVKALFYRYEKQECRNEAKLTNVNKS